MGFRSLKAIIFTGLFGATSGAYITHFTFKQSKGSGFITCTINIS